MDRLAFWREWFGPWGRELGSPARFFTNSPEDFVAFCLRVEAEEKPAYVSVNPFLERDVLYGLEKVFFDFDDPVNPKNAEREALEFVGVLRRYYSVEPLVVVSGGKGAHVYVWFDRIIIGDSLLLKRFLEKTVEVLLFGFNFGTLDRSASIDIKRLARVPYTVHNKTGRKCQPIGGDGVPLKLETGLQAYREKGFNEAFIRGVVTQLKREEERKGRTQSIKFRPNSSWIRPQVQSLIEKAKSGAHLTHRCYLIILFELINKGWSDQEIHNLFKKLFREAYDQRGTQYFIDHARKRGYLPFKTHHILEEAEQAGLEVKNF